MKFGKCLLTQMYPPWSRQYIDYKGLKKIIKSSNNDSDAKIFFFALDRDLDKVSQFYGRKINELEMRLESVVKRANTHINNENNMDLIGTQSLLEAFRTFQNDLSLFKTFVKLNQTGFRKILKKHDKKLSQKTQEIYLGNKVYVQPFSKDQARLDNMESTVDLYLEKLSDRLSTLTNEAKSIISDGRLDGCRLMSAVENRQLNEVEKFLEDLQKQNENNGEKWSKESIEFLLGPPFLRACYEGDELQEIINSFLESERVSINVTDLNGRTGLHKAVIDSHFETLQLLLKRGANVHLRDIHGRQPLHYACMSGNQKVVAELLRYEPSLSAQDSEGYTALFYSIAHGWNNCTIMLLDQGGDSIYNGPAYAHMTPLAVACMYGSQKIVKLLIERDIDVNLQDERNYSPLHYCCRNGHSRICDLLIDNGAEANVVEQVSNWTPLFEAARYGHLSCVEILIDKGKANVLNKDIFGWSARVYSLFGGYEGISLLLKEAEIKQQVAITKSFKSKEGNNNNNNSNSNNSGDHNNSSNDTGNRNSNGNNNNRKKNSNNNCSNTGSKSKRNYIKENVDGNKVGASDDDYMDCDRPNNEDNEQSENENIPPLSLPPPAVPFRHYGHVYLNNKLQLNVQLGSSQGFLTSERHEYPTTSLNDAVKFKSLKHDFLSLRLVMSLVNNKNDSESEPQLAMLPIQNPDEAYVFHADNLSELTLQLDVLPAFGSQSSEIIGRAVALPNSFQNLKGTLTCPLQNNNMQTLGWVCFRYDIITPLHLKHQKHMNTNKSYWRYNKVLKSPIQENSVINDKTHNESTMDQQVFGEQHMKKLSISDSEQGEQQLIPTPTPAQAQAQQQQFHHQTQHALGSVVADTSLDAQYIQATLQILSDDTIVINNEPNVEVMISKGHGITIPLSALNYQQLCHINEVQGEKCYRLIDVLNHFPIRLGFCLFLENSGSKVSFSKMNGIIESILKLVHEYGKSRPIILSSESQDVCLMMSLKQPNYPVFILVNPMTKENNQVSLRAALLFAKRHSLLGIFVPACTLIEAPILCEYVKEVGVLLFTFYSDSKKSQTLPPVDGLETKNVVYVGAIDEASRSTTNIYQEYADKLFVKSTPRISQTKATETVVTSFESTTGSMILSGDSQSTFKNLKDKSNVDVSLQKHTSSDNKSIKNSNSNDSMNTKTEKLGTDNNTPKVGAQNNRTENNDYFNVTNDKNSKSNKDRSNNNYSNNTSDEDSNCDNIVNSHYMNTRSSNNSNVTNSNNIGNGSAKRNKDGNINSVSDGNNMHNSNFNNDNAIVKTTVVTTSFSMENTTSNMDDDNDNVVVRAKRDNDIDTDTLQFMESGGINDDGDDEMETEERRRATSTSIFEFLTS